MAKLYKLIVLIIGLTAMNITVQAQVNRSSAISPSDTELIQNVGFTNYPNPAVSYTNIAYSLATRAKVNLRVVDLTGKQLAVLVKQEQAAGKQEYYWDLNKYKITSGMYILILQIDNKSYSRKVIVQ